MQKRDVIYRQQAIDAVEYWFFNTNDLRQPAEVLSHLSPAPPEITEEAVKEYCRKRDLCIVDSALLKKYASAQPLRKIGDWITIWDEDDPETSSRAKCSECGMTQKRPVGHFCKWCGADMRGDAY